MCIFKRTRSIECANSHLQLNVNVIVGTRCRNTHSFVIAASSSTSDAIIEYVNASHALRSSLINRATSSTVAVPFAIHAQALIILCIFTVRQCIIIIIVLLIAVLNDGHFSTQWTNNNSMNISVWLPFLPVSNHLNFHFYLISCENEWDELNVWLI